MDLAHEPQADLAAIRRLEELTLNTSPAIHEALYDGWLLRASGTDTRRANSVTALARCTYPLDRKIAHAEAWYRAHGQAAIFRLTREFSPAGLDAALEARGYSREVDTFVMTADLTKDLPAGDYHLPPGAAVLERTPAEGLDDLHRMKGYAEERHRRDLARQALWRGREAYLSLKTSHGIACTGMARIEDGHLGIFNMRTASKARGKGYATRLVAYLLAWGQEQAAHTAFLQVDQANAPALALYRKFGFAPRYAYWHRVAPSA